MTDFPVDFEPDALAEAEAAAARPLPSEPVDVSFVTIDPPGSRDLDQALHIERSGDGHRLRYAIADLAFFVEPDGALDRALWERGVTLYEPELVPLHPPVLSAGAASLLPDAARPAVVWTLDLDGEGAVTNTDVRRAVVRSTAQLTYADVPEPVLTLLGEVGRRRARLEEQRGGVSLPTPEQEVDEDGTLRYRASLDSENDNAQLSLVCGMAAADLMLAGGAGLLRTLPPAEPETLERLRRVAAALGHPWPGEQDYAAFIRSLDPFAATDAAILRAATSVLRGAAYVAFTDGALPDQPRHAALAEEYAHVTAPLRRLADRYATECALAAHHQTPVPGWVLARLADLPAVMAAADRRQSELERAAVDRAEATVLAGRVGEAFTAVAVDDNHVQLRDPAVRAPCDGDPPLGREVQVRLVQADPATGTVRFAVAQDV